MPNIDFMGNRKIMYGISLVLLVIAAAALLLRGLTFGIEFEGGTVINVPDAGNVSIEQMRTALEDAGLANPDPQTTEARGQNGFIIRTEETSPDEANRMAAETAQSLKMSSDSFQVTTIGPGWGRNITNSAVLALGLSILAILLYISLRYDYKMSITAVVAVVHDVFITLGIYALLGNEVTPNTIAALLTILGYSLYDTIVVFNRIKENGRTLSKQSFAAMANESINEVLVRSLNTNITAMLPILVMLFFGGGTLQDFALALAIGLLVSTYSSIGVASPLYVSWKETEPKFRALKNKYANA